MEVLLNPGTYVVAVSGGVDSVVLLDLLSKESGGRLIVAHYDHGIRKDSHKDREFVHKLAESCGLPFVFDEGNLGAKASEATAREARYKFLHKVRESAGAKAIVTAHHEDDVVETAILNMLRGTGRKGLASLQDTKMLKRPLLKYTKKQIKDYATKHKLKWREDPTNASPNYLRNRIRAQIVPKLSANQRKQLLSYIERGKQINKELDENIFNYLNLHPSENELDRNMLINLPHKVLLEVLASWLRAHKAKFDRKLLEKLGVAIKTGKPDTHFDIDAKHRLAFSKTRVRFV